MGKRFIIAMSVFTLIVVPLAIYTAGYFLLPDTAYWSGGTGYGVAGSLAKVDTLERIYPKPWQATIYRPAGKIEQWLRGVEVEVASGEPSLHVPIVPTPAPIIHVADWHWFPINECNDTDNRELVERIQQQQMREIRALGVREVWAEGLSDETITEFRQHILKLRKVRVPNGDSPVDDLIRDLYQEDLLLIGAAGRLLLNKEIDDVLPLEDHEAWQAAKPINCERNINADPAREQAMANRLPPGAVIVLGAGHDLSVYFPAEQTYRVVRVEALPEQEP